MAAGSKNPVVIATPCFKQPTESVLFAFDFSELLKPNNDVITEILAVVATPDDLTLGDPVLESPRVYVRISGGRHKQKYYVECRVRTVLNNIYEIDGPLQIWDAKRT